MNAKDNCLYVISEAGINKIQTTNPRTDHDSSRQQDEEMTELTDFAASIDNNWYLNRTFLGVTNKK